LHAQEATEIPTPAPLNPHFAEYMEGVTHGRITELTFTPEGHTLGFKPSPMDFSHLIGQPGLAVQLGSSLPSSYDLRNYGKVSPVKNQFACGDCWAFATFGSMESVLLTSESWNFSENNLNNLNGFDYGPCMGGNGQISTAYMARWAGPIKATDDPDSTSCTSTSSCIISSPQNLTTQKLVQNVLFIAARANSSDNDNLKTAIMTYGGVASTISSDELGQGNFYWNVNTDAYYYNGAVVCKDRLENLIECPSDHVITLVGWNDNYLASNFSTAPPGNGAFLVKNSWGTAFGSSGFFWISYYDARLAYDESYVFAGNENTTNYTTEYQYDPLGLVSSYGYGTSTAWAANVFTAGANGQLLALATYALANSTIYTIEIYTNASSGPTSGSLATTASGTITSSGYNTIVLPTPVAITKGQKFSVVIELTTPGYNYPVPVEVAVTGYSSQATASPGQSYMSTNGSTWLDTTTINSTLDVALKAFSNDQQNTTPTATTGTATAITANSATLAGTVNPNGADTRVWFLYGASSTLSGASQTNSQDLGSGTTATAASANLTSLNAGTQYYFQVVAQNSTGATNGTINTFTTASVSGFTISGTTVTALPGATTGNTSTITVTPSNEFAGTVALSCAITPTPASDPATCSLAPASVTISGTTAQTTLSVFTTAATSCSAQADPIHRSVPWFAGGGAVLACVLLFGIPARRRSWRTMLGMLALFLALTGGVLACGGGGSGGGTKVCSTLINPGTTAGAYTITVIGTSGSTTATGTVALTVQ